MRKMIGTCDKNMDLKMRDKVALSESILEISANEINYFGIGILLRIYPRCFM